tara:strand:- start:7274 stop:8968 length:1695 start_codon:yes stop_codon:yes gene_type:complete
MQEKLLEVEGLTIEFPTKNGPKTVVKNLNFQLEQGDKLGIVGESGSGKSMTALALMGLLPNLSRISNGQVRYKGKDLLTTPEAELRRIRGNEISMIFQEPMTSLNPVFNIGNQISEVLRLHRGLDEKQAIQKAVELLEAVRIPRAAERISDYPHQLSGGQRQRVMIAMALACEPSILIADEPTTALDVTVQSEIFALLNDLREKFNTSLILITHDMGVVYQMVHKMLVMYGGEKVEEGEVRNVIATPLHPYTRGLIACVPHISADQTKRLSRLPEIKGKQHDFTPGVPLKLKKQNTSKKLPIPALIVENLAVSYQTREKDRGGKYKTFDAVKDVSFTIEKGKSLGIVGESGAGKTSVALAIARLIRRAAGKIILAGEDFGELDEKKVRHARRGVQFIFQDPYSSLNPRLRAADIVREPMVYAGNVTRSDQEAMIDDLFQAVGLMPEQKSLFPHQFSGGQRQRIGIARALATRPSLIICDEPVSALDVAVQAQTLNLLKSLQEKFDLTYLFISHDMGVVYHMCDDVMVMYMGEVMEHKNSTLFFSKPSHPYSKQLLNAVPQIDMA